VAQHRSQDRNEDRRRTDQQRGVHHAGPLDAKVLQQDRPTVTRRTVNQDPWTERGAQPRPAYDQQHGRGEPEPREGEPAGCQPAEGQLGQGHRGTPQHPGGHEGREDQATTEGHTVRIVDD